MSLTCRSLPPCSVDELFINTIRQCTSLGRNDISKFTSRLGYHKHYLTCVKIHLERETFLSGILSGFLSPAFPLQCDRSHALLDCCVCYCFTVRRSPRLHRRGIALAQTCRVSRSRKTYQPSDPNYRIRRSLETRPLTPSVITSISPVHALLPLSLPTLWTTPAGRLLPARPHTSSAVFTAKDVPSRSDASESTWGWLPAGRAGEGPQRPLPRPGTPAAHPAPGRWGQVTASGHRRTHGPPSGAAEAVAGPGLNHSLGVWCYHVLRQRYAFVPGG